MHAATHLWQRGDGSKGHMRFKRGWGSKRCRGRTASCIAAASPAVCIERCRTLRGSRGLLGCLRRVAARGGGRRQGGGVVSEGAPPAAPRGRGSRGCLPAARTGDASSSSAATRRALPPPSAPAPASRSPPVAFQKLPLHVAASWRNISTEMRDLPIAKRGNAFPSTCSSVQPLPTCAEAGGGGEVGVGAWVEGCSLNPEPYPHTAELWPVTAAGSPTRACLLRHRCLHCLRHHRLRLQPSSASAPQPPGISPPHHSTTRALTR